MIASDFIRNNYSRSDLNLRIALLLSPASIHSIPSPTMFLTFSSSDQIFHFASQSFFFILTWSMLFFFVFSAFSSTKQGIETIKTMHQIPCSKCQFFTGSYQLKCTVNPKIALTEEAIGCSDYFCKNDSQTSYSSNNYHI